MLKTRVLELFYTLLCTRFSVAASVRVPLKPRDSCSFLHVSRDLTLVIHSLAKELLSSCLVDDRACIYCKLTSTNTPADRVAEQAWIAEDSDFRVLVNLFATYERRGGGEIALSG